MKWFEKYDLMRRWDGLREFNNVNDWKFWGDMVVSNNTIFIGVGFW